MSDLSTPARIARGAVAGVIAGAVAAAVIFALRAAAPGLV